MTTSEPVLNSPGHTAYTATASARIADDLAAAALIRRLGAPGTPTSVVRLRFSLVDALTIAVVAAITVYAFWGGALL